MPLAMPNEALARPDDGSAGDLHIQIASHGFATRNGFTEVLRNIDLSIREGEFFCLVGQSGCGKTTLLNMIAGFLPPMNGSVSLDGRVLRGPSNDRVVVFQDVHNSLFPWMTVRKNVEFGLKMQGLHPNARESAARGLLGMAGLLAFENHYPDQLSGGMKQRVGIVRALATSPQVMLMDEPFGALDSQTRTVMQEILTNMWQQLQLSVLFITHDIEEAIFLSEKVYVMTARPGRIKAEIPIPLPRPRTPEMTASPTFQALVRQLKALIREESLAAMGGELDNGGLQGIDHQFSHDGMKALI